MVRAPCCEKMGLKRGPWAPEEDRILISHIQKYGHSNWRALPKQAGLLRCGKSCRLRWINYLRPDIKRGNFSREEEETIIKLHEMLGNRWSAIAAKLPGRTDNEIKNLWHTHLKKRLKQKHEPKKQRMAEPINGSWDVPNHSEFRNPGCAPTSPQPTSTEDGSSVTEETCSIDSITAKMMDLSETLPVIEEHLWLEPGLIEKSGLSSTALFAELQFQIPFTSGPSTAINELDHCARGPSIDDGMDFWYNLFIRSGSAEDIPQT